MLTGAIDCPYCANMENVDRAFGCVPRCRRGACITAFDCRKYTNSLQKDHCFYEGQYYAIGQLTTAKYPDYSGILKCQFRCTLTPTISQIPYFWPSLLTCESNGPTYQRNCLQYLKLTTPYIYYDWYAIVSTTTECRILKPITSPPSSTCTGGQKCCKFGGKSYAWLSTVIIGSKICTCSCPPLLNCT